MASVKTFFEESYNELLHKVTWPTWSELQESTVLVFITILLFTAMIFLMDFVFGVSDLGWWKGILGWVYSILTA